MPLTSGQEQIISSTAPVIAEHGLTVTRHFYDNLLSNNPSLRNVFSIPSQLPPESCQPAALAGSLSAYATHISDLTPILPVVEKICQKHASLGILAEQYAIVGEGLLKSMATILGPDAFTDEVRDAWAAGYTQLADIMSGREEAIYKEHETKQGGWRGWRSMKIVKRERESEDVTSFYFMPADDGEIPDFRPGQYISVSVDVPHLGHRQIRQYSLSDAPPAEAFSPTTDENVDGQAKSNGKACDDTNSTNPDLTRAYRITVKRDPGVNHHDPKAVAHPGYVSNLLHATYKEGDTLEMSHPAGEFFLDQQLDDSTPVVLISAGVGLTPLMSMLQTLLKKSDANERTISWIHVAKNKAVDPFADNIAQITREHKNIRSRVYHSSPTADEKQSVDYDTAGRPDLAALDEETRKNLLLLDDHHAQYFICGPDAFMAGITKALSQLDVDEERVKMELFKVGS